MKDLFQKGKGRRIPHALWLFGIVVLSVHVTTFFSSPAFGETLNRVVAIVNEDVITLHELNKRIMEVTGVSPADLRYRDESGFFEARRMILEAMIDEKIAYEKIKELDIKVSPKELDQTIERIKEQNRFTHEDLLAELSKKGITYEAYRDQIKRDIERVKLMNQEIKSKIIIRDEQIEQYYQEHKDEYSTKGEVHLSTIVLLKKASESDEALIQRGREILARLKGEEDFGKLAREFSSGPGAEDGGDLGKFEITQLDPGLQKIIERLEKGGVSDLIVRPDGVQIIKLIGRTGGQNQSLDDVRNHIHTILYQEEINRRYRVWIKELRESSYTKIIF